jgi:DNA-binding MarR family transcriptional regulator
MNKGAPQEPAEDETIEEPVPGPEVDPAEQLAHLVPAIWRTMSRATRSQRDLPATEAQVTILRQVIAHGGLTPAQLADILHVARPTVSNLLRGLVRDGIVERQTSRLDARQVTIVPTDKGRSVLETFRHERTRILEAALADSQGGQHIDADDLVVTLRRLLHRLEVLAKAARVDIDETDIALEGVADPSNRKRARGKA